MNANTHRSRNWLGRFGLLAIGAVVMIEAAIVIVVLSLPVTFGLAVGLATFAVLALANMLTTKPRPARLIAGPENRPVEMVQNLPIEGWTHRAGDGHTPVAATVTQIHGACPLGLMPGNTWKIAADGALSRPMCRAAATALTALFEMVAGDVVDRKTCCECPLNEREVTFAVRETV